MSLRQNIQEGLYALRALLEGRDLRTLPIDRVLQAPTLTVRSAAALERLARTLRVRTLGGLIDHANLPRLLASAHHRFTALELLAQLMALACADAGGWVESGSVPADAGLAGSPTRSATAATGASRRASARARPANAERRVARTPAEVAELVGLPNADALERLLDRVIAEMSADDAALGRAARRPARGGAAPRRGARSEPATEGGVAAVRAYEPSPAQRSTAQRHSTAQQQSTAPPQRGGGRAPTTATGAATSLAPAAESFSAHPTHDPCDVPPAFLSDANVLGGIEEALERHAERMLLRAGSPQIAPRLPTDALHRWAEPRGVAKLLALPATRLSRWVDSSLARTSVHGAPWSALSVEDLLIRDVTREVFLATTPPADLQRSSTSAHALNVIEVAGELRCAAARSLLRCAKLHSHNLLAMQASPHPTSAAGLHRLTQLLGSLAAAVEHAAGSATRALATIAVQPHPTLKGATLHVQWCTLEDGPLAPLRGLDVDLTRWELGTVRARLSCGCHVDPTLVVYQQGVPALPAVLAPRDLRTDPAAHGMEAPEAAETPSPDEPAADVPLRITRSSTAEPIAACSHLVTLLALLPAQAADPECARTLGAFSAVPSWKRFLAALDATLEPAKQVRERREAAEERIEWRLVGSGARCDLETALQKLNKNGTFSTGRVTAPATLGTRAELLGDPRERAALAALGQVTVDAYARTTSRGRSALYHALTALADHPRLLHAATGRPVRVCTERLRLGFERHRGVFVPTLTLGPLHLDQDQLAAIAWSGPHVVALVEPPTTAGVEPPAPSAAAPAAPLCVLAELDEVALSVVRSLGVHQAVLGAEGIDEVVRRLPDLQHSLDVVLPPELLGRQVSAEPRLVLRLLPQPDRTLSVEAVARPISDGQSWPPGEGPSQAQATQRGERVYARRNLDLERHLLAELGALPPLATARRAGATRWSIGDDQQALELVSELRERGDRFVAEWPGDSGWRRVGRVRRADLRLRVQSQRDWLGLSGEVELAGQRIQIAALLEAGRRGRRFVRLGERDFFELETELLERLRRASDVVHPARAGLVLSPAAAEALSELVADEVSIEGDDGWLALGRRLRDARRLEPQPQPSLRAVLRPYQLQGYQWLARLAAWGMGACLADDMGLGKTVQCLAALLDRAERGPALIVAPTSVCPNWLAETERFAPSLRGLLYHGPERARLLEGLGPGDLLVTSYALLARDVEVLAKLRLSSVVFDEAHSLKNARTRRARAASQLDADWRVALTGTPVENHLGELWSLFQIIVPGLLGGWDGFRERFVGPIEVDKDLDALARLSAVLRPFLLRRTKAAVAPELPPRTELTRLVEPSHAERSLYEDARLAAIAHLTGASPPPGAVPPSRAAAGRKSGKPSRASSAKQRSNQASPPPAAPSSDPQQRFQMLAAITRLRLLACHPRLCDPRSTVPSSKLQALLGLVEELREQGHRALVFSQFTQHLALVREALDRRGITYLYLDGSTPAGSRAELVEAFQGGSAELFLISLKAGGSGLNLTAADTVIHLDPWWNPAVEDQASDRSHRIGQTRPVTVIRLILRHTIEEAVLALHADKRELATSLLDGTEAAGKLSSADLMDLIRRGADDLREEDDADE